MLAADRAAFRASSTARCFCITKGHGYEEGEGGKEENNTKAQNRNECVSWTNKTDSQVTGIHSLALLFVVLCCTQFSFLMQTTSKKLLHTHTHTHIGTCRQRTTLAGGAHPTVLLLFSPTASKHPNINTTAHTKPNKPKAPNLFTSSITHKKRKKGAREKTGEIFARSSTHCLQIVCACHRELSRLDPPFPEKEGAFEGTHKKEEQEEEEKEEEEEQEQEQEEQKEQEERRHVVFLWRCWQGREKRAEQCGLYEAGAVHASPISHKQPVRVILCFVWKNTT